MRQYLAEGVTGAYPFIVDRTKPLVTESRPSGLSITHIPGRFSVCDAINGNNRRYSRQVWEMNLKPGSNLQESIKASRALGLLEHPKDGMVTLNSPISHHVTKAEMVESRDANGRPIYEVHGEISLYDTDEGKKLKAMIEGGYNPMVSSRGYGSLKRAADGVDDVETDFVCESWDVVATPSFKDAVLTPVRDLQPSLTTTHIAQPVAPDPVAECKEGFYKCKECNCECEKGKPCKKCNKSCAESISETLKETKPSLTQNKENTMNLQEISGRIAALESTDSTKLSPQRFAESLAEVDRLHNLVAEAATEPKQRWQGDKLHERLEAFAAKLSESASAPTAKARKLTEHNIKLMKVLEATAKTGVTYKTKLGEALKAAAKQTKMVEALTERGQGWKVLAEKRGAKLEAMSKDYDTATALTDSVVKRYHEDLTAMGRRLLVLEFKEKAQHPSIVKQLKEAKRLRHILAIREQLEGKKPILGETEGAKAEGVGKPTDGEAPNTAAIKDKKVKNAGDPNKEEVAAAPGDVKNESKAAAPAAPVTEAITAQIKSPSQTVESAKVVLNVRNPRDLSESVDMVQRLSKATA